MAYQVPESGMDTIIQQFKGQKGELLGILETLQKKHPNNYLPEESLTLLSKKLNIPLSQLYNVVTFYAFFNLKPQGDHTITVCRGTACHTRGSKGLLDTCIQLLDLDEDEMEDGSKVFLTTSDNRFTVRTVACFGQCALAPVVEIDGRAFTYLTSEKLKSILTQMMDGIHTQEVRV